MATLRIEGQRPLSGTITVSGSKNSSTKILTAALLTASACRITQVPDIEDVRRILELLKSVGATADWTGPNEVTIQAANVQPEKIDVAAVGRLRASVVLMGALLGRTGRAELPSPGGDQIGSRPLDTHFFTLRQLGVKITEQNGVHHLVQERNGNIELTMSEFSVTATENAILTSVLTSGSTLIRCAAADPSVQDLCWFLVSLGAKISGIGTNTITIDGVDKLSGTDNYKIMPDPAEAGTFICLAGATRSPIKIQNVPIGMMHFEFEKFREIGLRFSISNLSTVGSGHYQTADVEVVQPVNLQSIRRVHNMPYPGFNPDILPPLTVLLTQAHGTSMVHDWMYEGRLKYVEELNKMGADIFVADPHRILVTGPRALHGSTITNYDIRTGASLLLASLLASGVSTISPVYQLDRGYEKIDERLRSLGAVIDRQET